MTSIETIMEKQNTQSCGERDFECLKYAFGIDLECLKEKQTVERVFNSLECLRDANYFPQTLEVNDIEWILLNDH